MIFHLVHTVISLVNQVDISDVTKSTENGLVINFDNHPNKYPNGAAHLGTQSFQVTHKFDSLIYFLHRLNCHIQDSTALFNGRMLEGTLLLVCSLH